MMKEGLKLLAAVARVDYNAWKYLLLSHCGLELGDWEEDSETEIIVRFQLRIPSNAQTVQNLVLMCGIQQHNYLRREYSKALAKIAAMDTKLHSKRCGIEISVPIEVRLIGERGKLKQLDGVLRHREAGDIIRGYWDEGALSHLEAGFRCTFVLDLAINADLSYYEDRLDLDMAKKIEELIYDKVWFSHFSLSLDVSEEVGKSNGDTRLTREIVGRVATSLFNSTRRLYESPTSYLERERHVPTTRQQIDKLSLSKLYVTPHCPNEWEALCSATTVSQTVRKLELSYMAFESKHWWKWLAYGFFSKQARTNSSLEALTLKHITRMTTPAIDAFCAVLSSEIPEELLFGCTSGADGVQDAALMANSLIRWNFNEQNEPVVTSDVLKVATPIRFLRILSGNAGSEWVNALIPGYGRCRVQRKNLLFSEPVGIRPGNNLKTLEMCFSCSGDNDFSGLPFFFAAIGTSLKTLTINTGSLDVDVKMILERCPKLERLCLTNQRNDAVTLNFSAYHAAGSPLPAITINFNDTPAFTRELMDTKSALVNSLQRLTISQYYDEKDRTWSANPEFRRELDAIINVLENSESLEYLYVKLQGDFSKYVKLFRMFHLKPINRSRLDPQCKIAFLSVLWRTELPLMDKRKTKRLEGSCLNWGDLDANVATNIFQFAAAPILRKVYVQSEPRLWPSKPTSKPRVSSPSKVPTSPSKSKTPTPVTPASSTSQLKIKTSEVPKIVKKTPTAVSALQGLGGIVHSVGPATFPTERVNTILQVLEQQKRRKLAPVVRWDEDTRRTNELLVMWAEEVHMLVHIEQESRKPKKVEVLLSQTAFIATGKMTTRNNG